MKYKVLIISNNAKIEMDNTVGIEYIVLNSPSKRILEETILKTDFDCIIPLQAINKGNNTYNILKVLDSYGLKYFGNNYLKYLLVNEKPAFIMQTELRLPSEIWTKYNYYKNIQSLSKTDFPIFIESDSEVNYLLNSINELNKIIDTLFSDKIDELIVYKNYSFDKLFDTVIIGNIPNFILASSDSTADEFAYLKEISIKLFSKYKFKDFAGFKFAKRGDQYFLLSINSDKLTNKEITNVMHLNYRLDTKDIINLYILVSSFKNCIDSNIICELSKKLSHNIVLLILPLKIKQKCGIDFDYNDICNDLKYSFLNADDSNKYEFIKMIEEHIENTPKCKINSYCLGDIDFDYDMYLSSFEEIPQAPRNPNDVLRESLQILNGQIRWNSPLSFYNICPPTMMNTVAASTITNIYNPNGMIDRTSAGYLKMEKQIIRQLSNLLDIDSSKSAGVFTSGGKICITYAVKCGLNRCQREFKSKNSPIVITSCANHFSIEDVCYQLGIEDCIRIPLTASQEMDYGEFEKCISTCIEKNIPIACVIVSGGNTMHSAVENINTVNSIITSYVKKYNLSYSPYIYYDMVVCWPWLFFKSYNFHINPLKLESSLKNRIKHISDILINAKLADGFGFDFHKGGFSPYATSLFIAKNGNELFSINSKNGEIRKDSCYHTFTNSRCTTGIISAWNVLQSVGISGFQAYIANMLKVAETLSDTFEKEKIIVLRKYDTYGFATLIWLQSPELRCYKFSDIINSEDLLNENNEYIYQFTEYLKRNGAVNICVRYLPKYNFEGNIITIISLLPMTMNINGKIAGKIAKEILKIKEEFDKEYIKGSNFNFKSAPDNVPR